MKRILIYTLYICAVALTFSACSDDDEFTTSRGATLAFSLDTLSLDTVFANISSPQKDFYVYNRQSKGVRITSVRLDKGNNSGFLVNVDGSFLGSDSGYRVNDLEVRGGDSIRVFVKLLAHAGSEIEPQKLNDDLVFTLESGVEQRIPLSAWTWNADILRNVVISSDSVLSSQRPIVIGGGVKVDSAATLTLPAGTTLYFQSGAGIDVYGSLICEGTADANVVLRGSRLDKMFPYLPFNNIPGQWNGVTLHSSSYGNKLEFTDIHGTNDGIVADSSDVEKLKLSMESSTVHNCQGYGVKAVNSMIKLVNCQITNTLYDCLLIEGGDAELNACTLAQFYPFDSMRGNAIHFTTSGTHRLLSLICNNSLITGYGDDVLLGESLEGDSLQNYMFNDCIVRTPKPMTRDSLNFNNVAFEDVADTTCTGVKHFKLIDTDNLRYDFQLDSISSAIGKASPATSPATDRNGVLRDETPDIGAFEFRKR